MTRRQAERTAWLIGIVGLIGAVVGWIVAPSVFPHAWLAALAVWMGWPVGCMGLLLVHALTGGRWGYATRPQLAAGMITLPLLLPAIVPMLIQIPSLYPWASSEVAAHLNNRFYLNLPFFVGRRIIYLIVWLGLSALILRALRQDEPDAALARIAPAGLILLAVTVSFSAIDTTMSLDPEFASSVYGLIAIAQMGLFALSVALFAAAVGLPPDESTMHSLGRLLLGLLVFWAYLDFMQLLIVWESDLSKEASWYALRWRGGWGIVAGVLAAGHFLLPFFALIWPQVQRSRRAIAAIAALLVLCEVVHGWWLVVPAAGRGFSPVDVLAMLGLLGIGTALSLRAPLLPMMSEAVRRHA
jgi:hypothetical protein